MNKDTCEVCFKIVCKQCGWEPNDIEVEQIQKEIVTNCPHCGWSPKSPIVE